MSSDGKRSSATNLETRSWNVGTRSVKPEWRGSGLLTRPHVARNHPGPPLALHVILHVVLRFRPPFLLDQ
jgi:hypothetical protein